MTGELAARAIGAVLKGGPSFCKSLSANDSGETGGHQSGILISTSARAMLFDEREMREHHILKKTATIRWQGERETGCTFTWYASKRELRVTGFGRGLSPLRPELTGSLFVLTEDAPGRYQGFILEDEDDIQSFLDAFGLTPAETNRPITLDRVPPETKERQAIETFIEGLDADFPSSFEMSRAAREICREIDRGTELATVDPDKALLRWMETEYRLFHAIEQDRYGGIIARGIPTVDELITLANQVLNRRKSRAGKSLEHHLSAIFDAHGIRYAAQAPTEGNKKPDFLFPSKEAYHDMTFPVTKLCTLAAKTTCKDRWRQILNEADRLRGERKWLCTLQQGISAAQMDEMQTEKVVLVVPKPHIAAYPRDRQSRIWTIDQFVGHVKAMQGSIWPTT